LQQLNIILKLPNTSAQEKRAVYGNGRSLAHRVHQSSPGADRKFPDVTLDRVSKPFIETVEASPAASVDGVQKPIKLPTKNSPSVKVNPVQEPFIETVEDSRVEVEQAQEPTPLQIP